MSVRTRSQDQTLGAVVLELSTGLREISQCLENAHPTIRAFSSLQVLKALKYGRNEIVTASLT